MAIQDEKLREVFVTLVHDCEVLCGMMLGYKLVLQACAEHRAGPPDNWEQIVQETMKEPAQSELVASRYASLYQFALEGLDDKSAQDLLDRVRRRHEQIQ